MTTKKFDMMNDEAIHEKLLGKLSEQSEGEGGVMDGHVKDIERAHYDNFRAETARQLFVAWAGNGGQIEKIRANLAVEWADILMKALAWERP